MRTEDVASGARVGNRESWTGAGCPSPSVVSGSQTKGYKHGTHRVVSPRETLARLEGHLAPMGITRVANLTGLDCVGIPVVAVYRPNARSLAVSQGKGVTLECARASGLMEAIEAYHAERVSAPLRLCTWNEMRFEARCARVERLPRIAQSRFSPERNILWAMGLNLLDAQSTWLPFELVHTNYTQPLPSGSGCFVLSSNGLASGNHHLEAICHGLCEVIERDAATLFHLMTEDEQDRRRIELGSIRDSECEHLVGCLDDGGLAVGVWEITSELGIPAFLALVHERSLDAFRRVGPVEGMGCHPVREVALSRALTEAAQGRLVVISGARDDNGRGRYADSRDPALSEYWRRRLERPGQRGFGGVVSHDNDDLESDLSLILGELAARGFDEVLAVDLTKQAFGIPVVRVVVPGLETHDHVQGYCPGARAREALAKAV